MTESLRESVLRLTRVHFFFVAALGLQIILYDAWKLIVPEVVLRRWLLAVGLLIAVTIIWLISHNQTLSLRNTKLLLWGLILADIVVAAVSVYMQRGMASRSVLLFVLPIVSSAVLLVPTAIYAVASLSSAAYIIATVSYFVLHFNEGYKIELYGEVGFYIAMFFVTAGLLSVLIRYGSKS